MSLVATMQKDGRLVIPKELRDKYGMVPGARVTLELRGGTIIMQHADHSDLPEHANDTNLDL